MRGYRYTPEEDKYIREHYAREDTVTIARKLDRNPKSIMYRASKLGMRKAPPMSVQCKGCVYWKLLAGGHPGAGKACHHLLDTGKRRERDGDKCLSYT